jgi:hypothetical protein
MPYVDFHKYSVFLSHFIINLSKRYVNRTRIWHRVFYGRTGCHRDDPFKGCRQFWNEKQR